MSLFRQVISKDFLLEVQQGNVAGYSLMWKFGYLVTTTTATVETIWGKGGLYTYHLGYGASAKKVDAVSDNAADVYDLHISGLDSTGAMQEETITLNGTTAVQSVGTYSRIFRAYNDNGVDFVGEVDIHETGVPANIISAVHPDDQQSLKAVYTIPLGYTGYLIRGATAIGAGKQTSIRYMVRLKDKVFRTQERFPIYENNLEADRPYLPIPELSDIEVRSKASSLNDDVSASFGILLVEN